MSDAKITVTATVAPATIEGVPPGSGIVPPAAPAKNITARVYHAGYGCDTGCCGHVFELTKPDGTTVERFEFDHPYTDAAGVAAWALTMAREVVADRWPECADSIDWSTIDVSEARDC